MIYSNEFKNVNIIKKEFEKIKNICEKIDGLKVFNNGVKILSNFDFIIHFYNNCHVAIDIDDIENLPGFSTFYDKKILTNDTLSKKDKNSLYKKMHINYDIENSKFLFIFYDEYKNNYYDIDLILSSPKVYENAFKEEMCETFCVGEKYLFENNYLYVKTYGNGLISLLEYINLNKNIENQYNDPKRLEVLNFFKFLKNNSEYSKFIEIKDDKNSLLAINFYDIQNKNKVIYVLDPINNKLVSKDNTNLNINKNTNILQTNKFDFLNNIKDFYDNFYRIETFCEKLKTDLLEKGYNVDKLQFNKKYSLKSILLYNAFDNIIVCNVHNKILTIKYDKLIIFDLTNLQIFNKNKKIKYNKIFSNVTGSFMRSKKLENNIDFSGLFFIYDTILNYIEVKIDFVSAKRKMNKIKKSFNYKNEKMETIKKIFLEKDLKISE